MILEVNISAGKGERELDQKVLVAFAPGFLPAAVCFLAVALRGIVPGHPGRKLYA